MDGVDQLNNILIIGMTNRKDMIDEALLRPGASPRTCRWRPTRDARPGARVIVTRPRRPGAPGGIMDHRTGRLEVHVEISLPDEAGRLQIINIHTTTVRVWVELS